MKDYSHEQLAMWNWVDWSGFLGAIVIQGLMVMRTFLDQSLSRYEQEQEDKKEQAL